MGNPLGIPAVPGALGWLLIAYGKRKPVAEAP
jgi:hypothetical protein